MKRRARIGFCDECDEGPRLLMPVKICPGVLELHDIDLCLSCRLNWRDDERWGVCLASTILHSRLRAKSHPRHRHWSDQLEIR